MTTESITGTPVITNETTAPAFQGSRKGMMELFGILNKEHPDYEEWKPQWDLYRDVLGEVSVNKEKYLPRGVAENRSLYRLRVKLSQFIPESQLALQKLMGALYDRNARREDIPPSLDSFIEDADLKGHHWNKVVEDVAFQLVGYGTTRILVNINNRGEGIPLTRADEIKKNIRPFIVIYNPLSVIDWETDEFGRLNMVRIKEQRIVSVPPPKSHAKLTRFIQYDRQNVKWFEFVEDEKGMQGVRDSGSSVHGLGVVPMVVEHFPKAVKPMIGSSFIRYAAKADVQKFQLESDLAYDTHVHAHPIFYAKVNEELAAVGIGSQSFIKLDPNANEEVGYVNTPNSAFAAINETIKEKRAMIYRQANIDPMGVLNTGTSQYQGSGVSRAWSFGTSEQRMLSQIADIMEKVERNIFDMALRMVTPGESDPNEPLFKGEIQYPEEFDISATEGLLSQTMGVGQQVNSETLAKTLQARVAASLVGDAQPDKVNKILEEITDNPLIGASELIQQENNASAPSIGEAMEEEKAIAEEDRATAEKAAAAGGAAGEGPVAPAAAGKKPSPTKSLQARKGGNRAPGGKEAGTNPKPPR